MHGAWHLQLVDRCDEAIGALASRQFPRLDQVCTTSSVKNGLPAVRAWIASARPAVLGSLPSSAVEQLANRVGTKRRERELVVVRLPHPRRLELGAKVERARERARPHWRRSAAPGTPRCRRRTSAGPRAAIPSFPSGRAPGSPAAPCRTSAAGAPRGRCAGTGFSGSDTPMKSKISGRLSRRRSSSSSRRPAMRSRAVASLSCSVTPKKARKSRRIGRNGIALPCATPVGFVGHQAARPATLQELEAQPALAQPRFADDADDLGLALAGSRQRRLQRLHLVAATDEPREATGCATRRGACASAPAPCSSCTCIADCTPLICISPRSSSAK